MKASKTQLILTEKERILLEGKTGKILMIGSS